MIVTTQPLKWHGGKSYLAKWIHSQAPPSCLENKANGYTHRNIAFAGGLGEFWNWLPIEGISETVNDLNEELATFYSVLRDEELFERFQLDVAMVPFGCDSFSLSKYYIDVDLDGREVERALWFFVRYRQSRQGLGKDYATPTTRTRRGMNENVSSWLSAVDGLPECHERLRRVEIRNMPAADFIAAYDHPRALFYLDPPYMHSTRSSTGEYQHEMDETGHAHLLAHLKGMKGRFMLSGYHSPMYDVTAEVCGWRCHEREIDNKASSAKTKQKKIECVWTNY